MDAFELLGEPAVEEALAGADCLVAKIIEHPKNLTQVMRDSFKNLPDLVKSEISHDGLDRTIAQPSVFPAIRTQDPLRTLIDLPDYGREVATAEKMENLIASAKTVAQTSHNRDLVEQHIAEKYLRAFRHDGFRNLQPSEQGDHVIPNYAGRSYKYGGAMAKHKPYEQTIFSLTKTTGKYNFRGNLFGTEREFASVIHTDDGIDWVLPMERPFIHTTLQRSDQLFEAVTMSRAQPRSNAALADAVDLVAEQEWLNAQTWRWRRGSAGISQLEARTWLEMADIDSTKFRKGVDPNLEALTRNMGDFKSVYPTLFESYPQYFSGL